MKIFDCFMYFDEDVILDVRLNTLDKYIDYFVIVESSFTHKGEKRNLNFDLKNFSKFKDKIIYLVYDKQPDEIKNINEKDTEEEKSVKYILNAIYRENGQRNLISEGLNIAAENDVILISDVDEIPNLEKVNFNNFNEKLFFFNQEMFYYKFNLKLPNFNWVGTKSCRKKNLISPQWLRNIKDRKYSFLRLDTLFSKTKYTNIKLINNGGWHFTNLKTPDELFEKLSNFGHHDEFEKLNITIESLKDKINKKEVFYNHFADKEIKNKWSDSYKLKKIDNSFLPKYLNDNHEKFNEWFDT